MGAIKQGLCTKCRHTFEYATIGGFNFAIVCCTHCSEAKSISWEEHWTHQSHGKCVCGGTFTNTAKVRCPKCNSVDVEELGTKLMFD